AFLVTRLRAADRGAAVIELAAPGLVSLRVRALARSRLNSRSLPSDGPVGHPFAVAPYVGERGRCVSEADPRRSSVPNGLDALGGRLVARGLDNSGENPKCGSGMRVPVTSPPGSSGLVSGCTLRGHFPRWCHFRQAFWAAVKGRCDGPG